MKTPRQILFDEHSSADAELARIQARVLALGLARERERSSFMGKAHFALATLWAELFLPARRIWIGFGAAWVVIVAVNLGGGESMPKEAKSAPLNSSMLMAWKQQQRMAVEQADLFEPQPAEPPKAAVPRPRSERLSTVAMG